MNAQQQSSPRPWTILAWLVLAALAGVGLALNDVSLTIGVGVAVVWALRFGFFPTTKPDRT